MRQPSHGPTQKPFCAFFALGEKFHEVCLGEYLKYCLNETKMNELKMFFFAKCIGQGGSDMSQAGQGGSYMSQAGQGGSYPLCPSGCKKSCSPSCPFYCC